MPERAGDGMTRCLREPHHDAVMPPEAKHWHGRLNLAYTHDGQRTVARHTHEGPLRVLKALNPEGDAVCHHVLVHPPSGMVGGDALRIDVSVGAHAHALITTPGATRFYRSQGPMASQTVAVSLDPCARLEWLPLETIVYPQARASNRVHMTLGRAATMIGWDVVCLGLPASNAPFHDGPGLFQQHLEVQGAWLERAALRADDARLLRSPLGLAGRSVIATAWVAWGEGAGVSVSLVDVARDALAQYQGLFAVTQVQPSVVLLRVLAHEPQDVWPLLRSVRLAWRQALWGLKPNEPRVWGLS
jgi:urease accessory protein